MVKRCRYGHTKARWGCEECPYTFDRGVRVRMVFEPRDWWIGVYRRRAKWTVTNRRIRSWVVMVVPTLGFEVTWS